MSQYSWTYLGDSGRKFKISLYHGMRTGHLLVHCNGKVLIIDFKVRQSKRYTIMVDDEMLDLVLSRTGDEITYTLEVNNRKGSPGWERDRKDKRRNIKYGLIFLFVIIAIVLLILKVMRVL